MYFCISLKKLKILIFFLKTLVFLISAEMYEKNYFFITEIIKTEKYFQYIKTDY